ncbi:hypothetical protein [Alteromonas sp. ASW11-130]|uniref:hypothetical protein n=1 Tax=Alteromonas sp. ASW11-130 TaxID=3015775 RepID=UPI0022429DFD|nr:hypothetical protein [Alteromonas sp. ASW11-130]MCW8091966.1 hypothetical protein [Alteromonas sp. ASW11-130]
MENKRGAVATIQFGSEPPPSNVVGIYMLHYRYQNADYILILALFISVNRYQPAQQTEL